MRNTALFLVALLASVALAAGQGGIAPAAEDISPLLPGEQVPEASYRKSDGSEVALSDLTSRNPTVLIYYRGGW